MQIMDSHSLINHLQNYLFKHFNFKKENKNVECKY